MSKSLFSSCQMFNINIILDIIIIKNLLRLSLSLFYIASGLPTPNIYSGMLRRESNNLEFRIKTLRYIIICIERAHGMLAEQFKSVYI